MSVPCASCASAASPLLTATLELWPGSGSSWHFADRIRHIGRGGQQALLQVKRDPIVLIAKQKNILIHTEVIATGAVDSVTFPVRR